jgi:hypothetical protein
VEVVKAADSAHGLADDQQRPAFAHDLERPGETTDLMLVLATGMRVQRC